MTCVHSATIFWVLVSQTAKKTSHWWILQTKKKIPNESVDLPTDDIRRGGSWSFLLHVDLWLGHALLMAPWIDESPWFGAPGAGRDSPLFGVGNGGYIYVISHKKIGGNPGITQVFLVGNGSTLWENTWNTQNDWVNISAACLDVHILWYRIHIVKAYLEDWKEAVWTLAFAKQASNRMLQMGRDDGWAASNTIKYRGFKKMAWKPLTTPIVEPRKIHLAIRKLRWHIHIHVVQGKL